MRRNPPAHRSAWRSAFPRRGRRASRRAAESARRRRRARFLQPRREFLRHPRRDAIVGVGRHHERRRIRDAVDDVVIRRVAQQKRKVGGVVGAAVLRNPEAADREAGDSAACRRPARGRSTAPNRSGRCTRHGADEQAAVAAAFDRDRARARRARSTASHSAAAMKSSNTFCFRSRMPARCQASPYSPPPRRFATAIVPPRRARGSPTDRTPASG